MKSEIESKSVKKIHSILRSKDSHWVGDGFPVRTLFEYSTYGDALSPFLLLDYVGPKEFPPTTEKLGVDEHPHRGFEAVTIVYEGEVEHRDSSGGGGKIGPGGVQWMTAGSGIVHEEFQGRDFANRGGMLEMVQLWVNLPSKDKMTAPRYQEILNSQIPLINLPEGQGTLRVIAGEYEGEKGPTKTFTSINVWDLCLESEQVFNIKIPDGHTTALVVLKGNVQVNLSDKVKAVEVCLFDRSGETIAISSNQNTSVILLSGEPLNEPIVGRGPFVMNTREEISKAIEDYQSGKMGHLI